MGQAAGTAAAHGACRPAWRRVMLDVLALQAQLQADGAYLGRDTA
jgi:tellurite resistance protein